jgi:hypothetical protein
LGEKKTRTKTNAEYTLVFNACTRPCSTTIPVTSATCIAKDGFLFGAFTPLRALCRAKKKKKSMPVNVTSQNYGKDEIERVLAAAKV